MRPLDRSASASAIAHRQSPSRGCGCGCASAFAVGRKPGEGTSQRMRIDGRNASDREAAAAQQAGGAPFPAVVCPACATPDPEGSLLARRRELTRNHTARYATPRHASLSEQRHLREQLPRHVLVSNSHRPSLVFCHSYGTGSWFPFRSLPRAGLG